MSRNQQSTQEQPFSPVVPQQKKNMKKEERAEKIKVCVRCRPINKKEKDERARRCVEVSEKSGEIRVGKKTYTFDKVFGPQSGQIEVYQNIVTPIINEVLQGKIFKSSENCTFEFGVRSA